MITLHIKKLIWIITTIVIILPACKKDDGEQKIVYGTFSLDIEVKHHSWNVPNIPLYLKRNATEYPGPDTSLYELKTIADSDGKASFDKLYPGKYYLFAKGYDYYFGAEVLGATPLNLTTPGSQNEAIKVTLMVSE